MRWRLTGAAAAFVLVSAVSADATQAVSDTGPRAELRGMQLASLFGESDEEKAAKAAQQQHEDNQDAQIADLKQRVHDLEQSLQQVTGQNELLGHRIDELSDRIDRQQKDFNYKLCSLAAQQLGTGTSSDQTGGGLPCDQTAAVGAIVAPQATPGSGGSLGTLTQGATTPDARAQYDTAMNLLAKAQYDEARAAFRSFADANPKTDLAPQALYWVADIAYVQKDYSGAAQVFAEQIKKYPKSQRSPDSMLKLGQSLLGLGQKEAKKQGCATLGAIKTNYPHASASVLSQAATVRATSCK
jgi:tol-pal system protein YbgF